MEHELEDQASLVGTIRKHERTRAQTVTDHPVKFIAEGKVGFVTAMMSTYRCVVTLIHDTKA